MKNKQNILFLILIEAALLLPISQAIAQGTHDVDDETLKQPVNEAPNSERLWSEKEPKSGSEPAPLKQISALYGEEYEPLSFPPRLQIKALYSSKLLADAQFLWAFTGNRESAFFGIVDAAANRSGEVWSGDLGFGYRTVEENRIFGFYILGNYSNSSSGPHDSQNFFVVNPGFEALNLGSVWDFRLNGYVPIGKTKDGVDIFAEINSGLGADFELGRDLGFDCLKLFLGGFYFNSKVLKNTYGGSLRLTYTFNNYIGLELKDTYDNFRHNVFMAGIRVWFGGFKAEDRKLIGISNRLLDPIENRLAAAPSNYKSPPLPPLFE